MAGVEFVIDSHEVDQLLGEMAARAANLVPAYKSIGEYLVRQTEEHFDQERDPLGKPWQDVTPATRRRKRHSKILTESTRLRGGIAYHVTANGVEVGTMLAYAAIHQFGGDIQIPARTQTLAFGRGGRFMSRRAASKKRSGSVRIAVATSAGHVVHMPQREFLGIGPADEAEIEAIVTDYIAGMG